MKLNAKHTVAAGIVGFITQAIVINFSPLLFITFEKTYGISLSKISVLIAVCFLTQLLMDLTASLVPTLFNKRITIVIGELCSALGLVGFALFPSVMPPYAGLVLATVIAAFGGGIIEVMGNPLIEACPIKNKNRILSVLHSGYCWGLVLTVLLSTLFFYFVGIEHWRILACLWAIVPALDAVAFMIVPIYPIPTAPRKKKDRRSEFRTFAFWAFIILMICTGAAEQAMSQWASSFAETAMGSKIVGDLLGPCSFAVLMGTARLIYAKYSERIDLSKFMVLCSLLCVATYLVAAFSKNAQIALLGCALCGFSVGIMWPGTLCLATERIADGGVKMFALLALAGDAGCTIGPAAVGWIADRMGNNIKLSLAFSAIFPIMIIVLVFLLKIDGKRRKKRKSVITNDCE